MVTNINAPIKTKSYSMRITELTSSRPIGVKAVNTSAIFIKDWYTMIVTIHYYMMYINEAIQISGKTSYMAYSTDPCQILVYQISLHNDHLV